MFFFSFNCNFDQYLWQGQEEVWTQTKSYTSSKTEGISTLKSIGTGLDQIYTSIGYLNGIGTIYVCLDTNGRNVSMGGWCALKVELRFSKRQSIHRV